MTRPLLAQLASTLLTACTPWLVSAIVFRVATALDSSPAPKLRSMRMLSVVTVFVAIATTAATLFLAWLPWAVVVAGVGFAFCAAVALRALTEIDKVTRSRREIGSAARVASLKPRRVGEYLPWSWRLACYGLAGAGVATFILRASTPTAGRELLVPAVFAAAGPIFLWLYEVWIHGLITGPIVAGDDNDLPRFVRRIFGMQLLLVIVCAAVAHALLNLDWSSSGALGEAILIAGGAVGIAGCGLALASGVARRRYEAVR